MILVHYTDRNHRDRPRSLDLGGSAWLAWNWDDVLAKLIDSTPAWTHHEGQTRRFTYQSRRCYVVGSGLLHLAVGLVLLSLSACQKEIDDSAGLPLHDGLEVELWQNPASAETLRAEIEIPGILSPTPLAIDLDNKTLTGNLTVPNQNLGEVSVILSYARLDADHAEVLVAESVSTITLRQDSVGQLAFPTLTSNAEDPRFDVNRNGRSNLDDLKIAINPAPTPNPIIISPRTVSFESGVDVGGLRVLRRLKLG